MVSELTVKRDTSLRKFYTSVAKADELSGFRSFRYLPMNDPSSPMPGSGWLEKRIKTKKIETQNRQKQKKIKSNSNKNKQIKIVRTHENKKGTFSINSRM